MTDYWKSEDRYKHIRRVEFAKGIRPISTDTGIDVDPDLSEHVETVDIDESDTTEDISSERAVVTDGGLTIREAADDAEILDDGIYHFWWHPQIDHIST